MFFVTTLNQNGTSFVFSTYVGGTSHDTGRSLKLDGNNHVYITGRTGSQDFPIVNGYDDTYNGGYDAYVMKLSSTGKILLNSTFHGGTTYEWASSLDIDNAGRAYITGWTDSTNFPISNAYDPSYNGFYDVFVSKFFFDASPYPPKDPNPPDTSILVPINTLLKWNGSDPDNDTLSYDVYFGTLIPPPKSVSNQSESIFNPGILQYNTTYYWQIVVWDNHNLQVAGPIWHFTTEQGALLNIEEIKGGLGINVVIANTGTASASGVDWQIHVEGGLLGKINKIINGTINIPAGESRTVGTGMFFGFGPLTITAKVADEEKTAEGTQIIIFSMVKK